MQGGSEERRTGQHLDSYARTQMPGGSPPRSMSHSRSTAFWKRRAAPPALVYASPKKRWLLGSSSAGRILAQAALSDFLAACV